MYRKTTHKIEHPKSLGKQNKIKTALVNSLVWHNAKDALTRLAITAHPTSFKKAHDGSIFIPNLISAFNVKDKYSFCLLIHSPFF